MMMQPLVTDRDGRVRFKKNQIVRDLTDGKLRGLSDFKSENYTTEDIEQFFQLIGYSAVAYCELSFVSDESKNTVCELEKSMAVPFSMTFPLSMKPPV